MFFHLVKYKIIDNLRAKEGIFWTLCFPLILATLFYFAFGKLGTIDNLEKINLGIVKSEVTNSTFLDAVDKSDLFIVKTISIDEAKEMLEKDEIDGYISGTDKINITVKNTGINQSIIKTFCDQYSQISQTVTSIYKLNPSGVTQEFMGTLNSDQSYIQTKPISESTNVTVVFFYALIAMTCLFAATYGSYEVISIQANQSSLAARLNVSPTHKLKIFFASILTDLMFQFISILIVLAYITQILKVDFGNSMGYVILLSLVAIFTGLTFGTAISAVVKASENTKIGIVSSVVMISCFLAGLMSTDVKYLVKQAFPAISYINPASIITDGFLSLYYYSSYEKYFMSIALLLGFSAVFSTITYLVLRRQKYASI